MKKELEAAKKEQQASTSAPQEKPTLTESTKSADSLQPTTLQSNPQPILQPTPTQSREVGESDVTVTKEIQRKKLLQICNINVILIISFNIILIISLY